VRLRGEDNQWITRSAGRQRFHGDLLLNEASVVNSNEVDADLKAEEMDCIGGGGFKINSGGRARVVGGAGKRKVL
jgi:hypothetical protein